MVGVPITLSSVRPSNRAWKFKLWLMRSTSRLLVLLAIALNLVSSVMAQDTPTPVAGFRTSDQASSFAGNLSTIYTELDQFWAGVFRVHSQAYESPSLASSADPVPTECAGGSDAFYCSINATMYLDPRFVQKIFQDFGDFAPIVVLAHEWGHHLQALTGAPQRDSTFELQADCLAGVFAREAEQRGLLDSGDITEAVTISGRYGDNPLWPQDVPGAHGTNDERITSFMTGYITGLDGCNLPGFAGAATQPPLVVPEEPVATGPMQPVTDLVPYLPVMLPLAHSGCFRIEDTVPLGFEEVVARLEGTDDARSRLASWGWQASANRTYACDTPPAGDAGWVDLSLHLFGSPEAAQEAVDYFAALRAHGTRLVAADPSAMGDHAAVLTGPTTNGTEFTLYVSDGPLLVRVTGVSPDGIPFMNVLAVAGSVLASVPPTLLAPSPPSVAIPTAVAAPPAPTQAPQPVPVSAGIARLLPGTLPLPDAACFMEAVPLVYTFPELVERFPGVPDAAEKLQALGWQEGAYTEYVCGDPAEGELSGVYLSVHRFPDAAKASAAAVFFASSRALDTQLQPAEAAVLGDSSIAIAGPSDVGEEYTLYVAIGPYLLRVTGIATEANPRADVEHVMLQLLADVLLVLPPTATIVPPALPTGTPIPTVTPIPTSTVVPTATPSPTAPPTPTATPQPTSTPAPTSTPVPTASPTPQATGTPTPMPSPTASTTPIPMPSPTATVVPTATPRTFPTPTTTPHPTATPSPVSVAPSSTNPSTLPTASVPRVTPPPTSGETTACVLVELYPGYPGYRGYIAGVKGPGETACLQDLFMQDPSFDRAAEDAANLDAARAIGLNGSPVDWTWENWMAIEGERGLPPTCYSCLILEEGNGPDRQTLTSDPDDPRLLLGGPGTTGALLKAAAQAGIGPTEAAFFRDLLGGDIGLRAYIGLSWPGNHNAPEMLAAYTEFFRLWQQAPPRGTQLRPASDFWGNMLDQGGYAPTPATAYLDDQLYMVRTSVAVMCSTMTRAGGTQDYCPTWYGRLEGSFLSALATSSSPISYRAWLRENAPHPF